MTTPTDPTPTGSNSKPSFRVRTSLLACLILAAAAVLPACNGVTLSAQYSTLLDQTTALSMETADRNRAGGLTPAQVQQSLDGQAAVWQSFRDARDGRTANTHP